MKTDTEKQTKKSGKESFNVAHDNLTGLQPLTSWDPKGNVGDVQAEQVIE